MKKIIILLGHGSPEKYASKVLLALKKKLLIRFSKDKYDLYHAFLQFNKPSLEYCLQNVLKSKIDNPARGEARHRRQKSQILILPVFLSHGRHLSHDAPKIIKKTKLKHKGVGIKLALPLGSDDLLVKLLNKRIKQAFGSRH